VITADTPAARELLADGESALLVPPGDAEALADALRTAADNRDLLTRIAQGGRRAYEERASEDVLGRRWRDVLEALS
jgi:glycosyltransferase involved in cell wall biosynthesis